MKQQMLIASESRTRGTSSETKILPDSITTQDTNQNNTSFNEPEIDSHQLVRRYTEDLDNERILIELEKAKRKYTQGRKLFE